MSLSLQYKGSQLFFHHGLKICYLHTDLYMEVKRLQRGHFLVWVWFAYCLPPVCEIELNNQSIRYEKLFFLHKQKNTDETVLKKTREIKRDAVCDFFVEK